MEDIMKIGPFGNCSSDVWDDKGKTNICGIYVFWSNQSVTSIQFTHAENTSHRVLSQKIGGFDNGTHFKSIRICHQIEMITGISGFFAEGSGIKTITFYTNLRSYGPFGPAEPFGVGIRSFEIRFSSQEFYGFHGYSSQQDNICAIGVYLKTPLFHPSSSKSAIKSEKD